MNIEKLCNEPLKLKHNRVWRPFIGGKMLDQWQGIPAPQDGNEGEEWVASTVDARNPNPIPNEGLSKVIDGEEEYLLADLIKQDPALFLGKDHATRFGENMAILVKVLDSYSRLLIQVHPDKDFAQQVFESKFGKTEAWYILGGRKVNGQEPYVYVGFKPGITKEIWEDLFEKQDVDGMLDALQRFNVSKGDLILIEGGVPHAIGEGCLLIEIQEPTDYTIRVEKHKGDGSKLPEHMLHQGIGYEKMFDCFHYNGMEKEVLQSKYMLEPELIRDGKDGAEFSLIKTPFFAMNKYEVIGSITISKQDIFAISIVVEGEGYITYKGKEINIKQGDTLFIPAGVDEYVYKAIKPMQIVEGFPPSLEN